MVTRSILWLAERGLLPDSLIRLGIRRLCRERLHELHATFRPDPAAAMKAFLHRLAASAVAELPELANAQHYEVPAAFYERVLGRHLKYSSCYYDSPSASLDDAEARALDLTVQHADLKDGQRILELGCGWGSLSLTMAERFPNSSITGVSNSHSQREHIMAAAEKRGLRNLRIVTEDMNCFTPEGTFDRMVSVEMLEHIRNQEALLARIATWLRPEGRFFFHVFCHREFPYTFDAQGASDWMARHFFSGGLMPNRDLIPSLAKDFEVEASYDWDGTHYARTAEHWLANQDAHKDELLSLFGSSMPRSAPRITFQRWRIFFLACAELFAFDSGSEWGVVHHRLRLRSLERQST